MIPSAPKSTSQIAEIWVARSAFKPQSSAHFFCNIAGASPINGRSRTVDFRVLLPRASASALSAISRIDSRSNLKTPRIADASSQRRNVQRAPNHLVRFLAPQNGGPRKLSVSRSPPEIEARADNAHLAVRTRTDVYAATDVLSMLWFHRDMLPPSAVLQL